MSRAEQQARELLLEAFTAGWQAALAINITNPRVLAVVESCFEKWLSEAVDDTEVLGLSFRGRIELPPPSGRPDLPDLWAVPPQRRSAAGERRVLGDAGRG